MSQAIKLEDLPVQQLQAVRQQLEELSDIHKVIVDVGTGYLVEKSVEDATDFYKRKVEFLKTNLLGLQDTVVQRRNQRASVINMIEAKVSMMKKGPEMAPTSAVAQ
ncbi:hypothetical protein BASA61_005401 [Batrachochytrium salamandrivorans]|nr:hypothetical protein BASA62_007651 [Batrachochytrium salamandrivorans]KAH6566455.1 hypothetical protein BASA60_009476 [Batrachochytrium salamandrivorans]KAH6590108.1 hypothetical protein BASA61_005401 [Batrachochytrium salamandrivorans]KAH9267920.1 prefoldin, alpha subunit [Batrachochytrium salamandrivorans]